MIPSVCWEFKIYLYFGRQVLLQLPDLQAQVQRTLPMPPFAPMTIAFREERSQTLSMAFINGPYTQ
jgi:hypothetical protein